MQTTQQQQQTQVGNANQQAQATNLGNINNTTTATANPLVASAASNNLGFVQNLQNNGFQGYTGPQVASLSGPQAQSIGKIQSIANDATGARANDLISQYASAGPQSVTAGTVTPQTTAQNMSPYMNQYVMQALAPQLQQMDIANAQTNQATDALATSHGAYGDARQGVQSANNAFLQNVAREGVIGNAYNHAFDTAISAGAGDADRNFQGQNANVSNNLAAQNSNAGYNEQALARALGGSNALQGLQNQQIGAQNSVNSAGQQLTANNQANLTAAYNQWLMSQQYPFQTAGLVNSTIGQASSAMPASTNNNTQSTTQNNNQSQTTTNGINLGTTQQPNNSGLGVAGALLSAFI